MNPPIFLVVSIKKMKNQSLRSYNLQNSATNFYEYLLFSKHIIKYILVYVTISNIISN